MSKTRLFQSIKSLNVEAVASLLGAHPELKQVKDERGRNALHLLCSLPSHEKKTALHFLLKKNSDRKHIEMLLRYGADPTLKNADGVSPLDMVANRRDKTLFNLLSKRREGHR